MNEQRVPYTIMDDLAKWRNSDEQVDVLIAGLDYLHNVLEERHPKCSLGKRIRELGDFKLRLLKEHGADPTAIPIEVQKEFLRELNLLGTIGYGMWHLKQYSDSSGFRFELKELARADSGENAPGTEVRLRGQGFLFHAAGVLARDGFAIEFINQKGGKDQEQRPDFFAVRDGNRYACEATTKKPKVVRVESVGSFWRIVLQAVEQKKEKFRKPEFQDGVLLVDCTPVFHLLDPTDIPIGGTLLSMPGLDEKGPPGGEVPLIRFDESEFSQGLRSLGKLIEDVGIRNVMLWNREFGFRGDSIHRRDQYRVLGTIGGKRFWAYFPKAVVFPAKGGNVIYPDERRAPPDE